MIKDMENKRHCPIMNREIDGYTCYEIHMVIDGGAPARIAPPEVTATKDYKNICYNCPRHIHEKNH